MRPDKVAQRKNKSRKPKSLKQDSRMNMACSSPASTSISDICDITDKKYVLEEIVNVDGANINLDIDTLEIDLDPAGSLFQITPALKFTIEEEFKICEIEAANDHVVKSLFQTLVENVPNFQESISLFLYSKAMGVSFDMTPVTVLSWMKICKYAQYASSLIFLVCHFCYLSREAIFNDLIVGGNMAQALNRIEVFNHIPCYLKIELFTSTIGSCDIFKRYYDLITNTI